MERQMQTAGSFVHGRRDRDISSTDALVAKEFQPRRSGNGIAQRIVAELSSKRLLAKNDACAVDRKGGNDFPPQKAVHGKTQ